jgi:two-component system phosphate regulon sensor histidine kinase PhoR
MPARSWKFHLTRLLLCAALVVLIGWLAGHLTLALAIGSVAYLGWQLDNLRRLHQWIRDPEREPPESLGLWAEIFEEINTLQKRNRGQKEIYQSMIEEFRSLTDAFPDATLVIEEDNSIAWFNKAAMRMLGLKAPDDLGQPVTNLIRGSVFANWLAIQSEVRSPLEMASPREEGAWLTVTSVAFRENQRLIIVRDTTRIHNLEQVRRDFVANISHELRTPLTVLRGYLEMLMDHPAEDVNASVKRMLTQALQMQTLLDDLLELSRLQNDELRGEEERVDVPTLLMQLKEQAEELSRGDHEISFEVDRSLCLSGSAPDLESAFSNLITNATKYTPKGGHISVTWKHSSHGPRLSVRDTGIGIPSRDIPRLTERFYRVGSDRARNTGGSGLGLAIVKHVLNAHQAELSVISELGQGSEFVCTFPEERARTAETTL